MANYLSFLVSDYGFYKVPDYQLASETHTDYVNRELIIKVVYNGSYWIEILKPNFDINELVENRRKTIDFSSSKYRRYNLANLDLNKAIWNSVSSENFPDKELWYASKLLKDNDEILRGDLRKLNWMYRFKKKLKFI